MHQLRFSHPAYRALAILTLGAFIGCSSGDSEAEGPVVFVPEGKEDNFLSQSAQEYLVEGETFIVLDDSDLALSESARLERVKRLIPYKQVVVAWFLNAWIAPKDKSDRNYGYGGFDALTKNGSFQDLDIHRIDERTYGFTTRQQLAGAFDLLERLPVTREPDGRLTFQLALGQVSNSDMQNLAAGEEWFRSEPWEHFDPRTQGELTVETIGLTITAQPRSLDGWVDTPRLFADGKVTIGVHFGWDYHKADHIAGSRQLYRWLVDRGFESPVASYDQLTRTSRPFTKTIKANGTPVAVELWLYWGKPGASTDPDTDDGGAKLKADLIKSLETREVIIYSGHSGPFWGFSMANWRKTDEGELDDNEIAVLDLPASFQLVLAEGCETYAIGQAFMDNPAKAGRDNIDIVTTTTYSTAEGADPVVDFLEAVVGTHYGSHVPWTYGELLQALDYNAWDPAMYGVHGIDDAPHLHPYANPSTFCSPCEGYEDCGADGNICVALGSGDDGVCTAECTGDDGCPSGYTCAAIARDISITGRACVPRSFSCDDGPPATRLAIINEVMADPPNDPEGDLNGDGYYDAAEDEFVEIYNSSEAPLSLEGWTVADGTKVRFTFPVGARLDPGQVAVVFGGGEVDALTGTGAELYVAEAGLALANAGDTVILRSARGAVIDRLVYGAEGGGDRSLVRAADGDGSSDMVVHSGSAPASPGLRTNGMPF